MSKILTEISQMKYLFGYKRGVVISEQVPEALLKQINDLNVKKETLTVKYMKCEGGEGEIDPKVFTFSNIGDKMIIKFILEPTPKDETDSILTCLGGDEPMKDKCFEVNQDGETYMAGLRVDCTTGKYN
jgi:hypothetical protein